MSKTLVISTVKCLVPSSGIAQGVVKAAQVAAVGIAAGTTIAGATATAGASLFAVAAAGAGAAGAVDKFVNLLDAELSGRDELYIKVDGQKIFPDGKYHSIGANQEVYLNKSFSLSPRIQFGLWEWDNFDDDYLGGVEFTVDMNVGPFQFLVRSDQEGSLYEIKGTVEAG